jgi:hypothetical protein
MLDFTEELTWFVAGFAATLILSMLLLVAVFFAWLSEQHFHEHKS